MAAMPCSARVYAEARCPSRALLILTLWPLGGSFGLLDSNFSGRSERSQASDPSAPAATPDRVLQELSVENLLLIEQAQLRLAPGLNVITGETGAGKTVLAHALDLLLGGRGAASGGRGRPSMVRPGAAEAYVEGVFDLTPALHEKLGDRLSPDADELILAPPPGPGRRPAPLP